MNFKASFTTKISTLKADIQNKNLFNTEVLTLEAKANIYHILQTS